MSDNTTDAILQIDDVTIQSGQCEDSSIRCDFEHGFCTWNNDRGTAQWQIQSAGDPGATYGPPVDHTFNSTKGNFFLNWESYKICKLQNDPLHHCKNIYFKFWEWYSVSISKHYIFHMVEKFPWITSESNRS